jgi:single-strand DNA-binding protein
MHDVALTLVGNVVSDPQERTTESGAEVTSFRMAINPRKYDRFSSRWVDGESMFFTVVCWRQLANNVAGSINKGDPVIVHGKLKLRRWDTGERQGTMVEIEAVHIGHDLTRGVASFTRTRRVAEDLSPTATAQIDYWEPEGGSTAA